MTSIIKADDGVISGVTGITSSADNSGTLEFQARSTCTPAPLPWPCELSMVISRVSTVMTCVITVLTRVITDLSRLSELMGWLGGGLRLTTDL